MQSKKYTIFIALIALVLYFSLFSSAFASTNILNETFNAWNLGNITSSPATDWIEEDSNSNYPQVVSTNCFAGQCVLFNSNGLLYISDIRYLPSCGSTHVDRSGSAWFYIEQYPTQIGDSFGTTLLSLSAEVGTYRGVLLMNDGNICLGVNSDCIGVAPLQTWFKLNFYSTACLDGETNRTALNINYDGGATIATQCYYGYNTDFCQVSFGQYTNNDYFKPNAIFYVDNVGDTEVQNTSPTVSITSPADGSTITDLSTNLVGTYINLGSTYENLTFYFQSGAIGESSTVYTISDLDPSGSGSFSIPLTEFDLPTNGDWILHAVATLKTLQLSDMLVSSNLVSNYDLILNISGLTEAYNFTNFSDWYTANASGDYTTPTDIATTVASFFSDIFVRVGGYTNRLLSYFDSSDAYSKGYTLGIVFPTTDAYLDKISVFLGGFPLSLFFKFSVIIVLAIFIIKAVFKFIPFFG